MMAAPRPRGEEHLLDVIARVRAEQMAEALLADLRPAEVSH